MSNLPKCKVIGDPQNPKRFSSNIIIDSLNDALWQLDLYKEDGIQVNYSCVCSDHNQRTDVFICTYEIPVSQIILAQAKGRRILGVSLDNYRFLIDGGAHPDLCGYFPLGVDSFKYKHIKKTRMLDTFNFLVYTESLVRSNFYVVLDAFGEAFSGSKTEVLYIKDRNGTDRFKQYVEEKAKYYNVIIKYENNHLDTIEKELEVYECADVHVYVNASSTFAMPCLQLLSCGVPSIVMSYSGPAEYIRKDWNAITIPYRLEDVNDYVLRPLIEAGMRNFFFADGYECRPYWAVPDKQDLKIAMTKIRIDSGLMKKLSRNGRLTAEQFTWKKSAAAMCAAIKELY